MYFFPVKCPSDHPYAFKNGLQCCKTNKESKGHIVDNGEIFGSCDGIKFSRESPCCKDNEYVRCEGQVNFQRNRCIDAGTIKI